LGEILASTDMLGAGGSMIAVRRESYGRRRKGGVILRTHPTESKKLGEGAGQATQDEDYIVGG